MKQLKQSEQKKHLQAIESLELIQQARDKKGRQLKIDINNGELREIDELKELIKKDFENPDEKYNLYYNGIRKILISYLPKGRNFKQERDLIYDEKNIFLNRGKRKSDNSGIRKSDGRMAANDIMNEMLDVIIRWVSESQNPNDLYNMLYELNDKKGYGHEEYDQTAKKMHLAKTT